MIRRLLSFFFGCSAHGSWDVPDRAVTIYMVRCNRRAFHDGPHDFNPDGIAKLAKEDTE